MAAIAVHQFAECITCHAWCPDHSMVAFCPNDVEVHIYKLIQEKWEKLHVLQNARVDQEGSERMPTLVVLRPNRAVLCVQWSPKENKFAVGSGAKTFCVCYYEQENNWWVSKLIRKKHKLSVTSIAWHPNNILLATISTDGKCRVFFTFIKGVDSRIGQKNRYMGSGEPRRSVKLSAEVHYTETIQE